jgi:hypothetical protein
MASVLGNYFIIHKHWKQTKGKRKSRRFYGTDNVEEAIKLVKKYAEESDEDYLIVKVVAEASAQQSVQRTGRSWVCKYCGKYNGKSFDNCKACEAPRRLRKPLV